ncbi:MAG TPA: ATP synthase F1 subunit epsilon [Firmicutes bacterium]|nr:ATP synthase F1 subunit epsilon [Bacillota bacterium]
MFPLHVLAADKPFYEGDCESLVVPTLDGEYGVLAGHCNTICAIVPGELTFRTPDGETLVAAVASGIMKIENGEALVLVDSALRPEDIDAERQRRKADEAKEALLQRRSIEEHHAAQARLARALARLNVKRKYGQ